MPSWHQRKRPVQLWHETQWTVYTNAYNNDPSGLSCFLTEAEAIACARPGLDSIIPPATVQRARYAERKRRG